MSNEKKFWIDVNKPDDEIQDLGVAFFTHTFCGAKAYDGSQPELPASRLRTEIESQVLQDYPEAHGIHSVSRTESLDVIGPNKIPYRHIAITGMAYKRKGPGEG